MNNKYIYLHSNIMNSALKSNERFRSRQGCTYLLFLVKLGTNSNIDIFKTLLSVAMHVKT